jgi:sulfur-oxidizing protein SoxX
MRLFVSAPRIFFAPFAAAGIAVALSATAYAQSRSVADAGLVPYTIVGDAIPKPLTSQPGDPKRGQEIVMDRKQGGCLSCHNFPIAKVQDPGNVGPPLGGVGRRLDAGQLRLRVVDLKALDPSTIMPSFYRTHDLHDVETKFDGKPMLEAQQIEDVVAYLETLK